MVKVILHQETSPPCSIIFVRWRQRGPTVPWAHTSINRRTDHRTCGDCSNRPHLCDAMFAMLPDNMSRYCTGSLSSRVVSVLDSGAEGPGFKSQPRRCLVTVLEANCSHPSCLCSPSSKIGSSPLKGCGGNCRPGGK